MKEGRDSGLVAPAPVASKYMERKQGGGDIEEGGQDWTPMGEQ